MCGITGIINKDQSTPDAVILTAMADTLSHRGKDGEGSFSENNIAFYHKRLAIFDLKKGSQPMTSGNLTIVFNGAIYNYPELRSELISKGYTFSTDTDTEVILRMYDEYGTGCINQLNGMFAFALYDSRRKQVILCRDHFGIKPLYYFVDDNHILFASEIKALLRHPVVKREVNIPAMKEYLTFQFVLNGDTFFNKIYKVSPGHFMEIDLNDYSIKTVKYWNPDFSIDTFHTEEYFIHELDRLIKDTVRMQLRTDTSIGAYLSGGIDSSIVTVVAASMLKEPIQTFTGGFKEGSNFDETHYSRITGSAVNAQQHFIYPTAEDFVNYLPEIVYCLDEPVAGPGSFPQYMVSKLASENATVVLGGQGGDEIFCGYARYVIAYLEQALKGMIHESSEEGNHIVTLHSILPNLRYLSQYEPMMKKFWSKELFEAMDRRYFHLIDRMNGSMGIYNPDFYGEQDKDNTFIRFQRLFNDPNTQSYINKMSHFDMFGSLPALLQVEDRMSMASTIESRVPLLDRRIVDLLASVPPRMKFAGGEMKYLLKTTMGYMLPEEILNRKDKMGFPVPLHIWAQGEARDFVCDILMKASKRDIYNRDQLLRMVDLEVPYSRQLWGILCMELWYETFIDKQI